MSVTRRSLVLGSTALAAAALTPRISVGQAPAGPFKLPPLPYAADALEPHIDARTMEIHHDRHHKAYVDNLNKALAGQPDLGGKPIQDLLRDVKSLPKDIQTAVVNNGGGHANHSMFWQVMGPNAGGQPGGELGRAIDEAFGSFDKFQAALTDAALKRFGSGWSWLVLGKDK